MRSARAPMQARRRRREGAAAAGVVTGASNRRGRRESYDCNEHRHETLYMGRENSQYWCRARAAEAQIDARIAPVNGLGCWY